MFFPFVRRAAAFFCWGFFLTVTAVAFGQTNYYSKNGTEYAIAGSLPGDQVFPDVALASGGGFVVWQDNATDGNGWGISARRLNSTLSGTLSPFRVNQQGTNDQQNPRVTLLKNGGAAFVWQGGKAGYQRIFARFLTPTNTFLTSTDLVVSKFTSTNTFQVNPAVTTLNNSNVVVLWGSFDQAGTSSMQDVFAKILSPTGQTISNEFLVNQFTTYNQRTPAVAALKDGGFVAVWVSEQQRVVVPNQGSITATNAGYLIKPSVDIYARLYASNGAPRGGEFLVSTNGNPAANPAVAAGSDGGFMVTWGAWNLASSANGPDLDVYARPFAVSGGVATGGSIFRVNSYLPDDQYAPRIAAIGLDYLIAWISVGQDGSREGVFGQFVHNSGAAVGGEIQVNTTTISRQIQPVVASDGAGQFLAVWAGYAGQENGFDLFAQRYLNVAALLPPMAAPFVYAPFTLIGDVYQPELQVTWPPLAGIPIAKYEVYVDGSGVPAGVTTDNSWTMTVSNGLAASSTHSFQVDYVTTGNSVSPISPPASGTTWSGGNYFGIPIEWMEQFYGSSIANWPADVNALLAPGGLSLRQVFMSGGNPLDSSTWLRSSLVSTDQGMFLSWNTVPGLTYQVQSMSNFVWSDLGAPRFAAGTNDSIFVGGGSTGYYRVLLRQ